LVVNGVRDIAAAANSVSNAVLRLGIEDLVVSRDGTWKYLLTVTNQNIQTNYYRTTFDDSSWAGPSPGVLHVEDGGLPGGWVKGTRVSPTMFQEVSATESNYLNTVYFRKTVSTPFVGGTVRLRGRVLYDDGVVIYVNGVELARYTMPAGAITAATQASGGHEAGDSVPTIDIVVTNWVAGNNVIAAEVHQSGGYFVSDLGSANGTHLNEEQVEMAELNDGDRLRIGNYTLTVGLRDLDCVLNFKRPTK
jgi:hypothetical protein